ncbi:hypothetical protein [Pseudoalteromonas sp. McH1-42]|uniref:hypothetical protein n=1 Tax=Pseudoalteromonas sp. McH1-42 TaxID=2917752 RepID=UPI001EF69F03|nr:hypothetical protein [Pseudoalteromonas sp. McH1-42]MCG7563428.1 hypothetical protein [Pseudoalteromonas sp. McH1-42]
MSETKTKVEENQQKLVDGLVRAAVGTYTGVRSKNTMLPILEGAQEYSKALPKNRLRYGFGMGGAVLFSFLFSSIFDNEVTESEKLSEALNKLDDLHFAMLKNQQKLVQLIANYHTYQEVLRFNDLMRGIHSISRDLYKFNNLEDKSQTACQDLLNKIEIARNLGVVSNLLYPLVEKKNYTKDLMHEVIEPLIECHGTITRHEEFAMNLFFLQFFTNLGAFIRIGRVLYENMQSVIHSDMKCRERNLLIRQYLDDTLDFMGSTNTIYDLKYRDSLILPSVVYDELRYANKGIQALSEKTSLRIQQVCEANINQNIRDYVATHINFGKMKSNGKHLYEFQAQLEKNYPSYAFFSVITPSTKGTRSFDIGSDKFDSILFFKKKLSGDERNIQVFFIHRRHLNSATQEFVKQRLECKKPEKYRHVVPKDKYTRKGDKKLDAAVKESRNYSEALSLYWHYNTSNLLLKTYDPKTCSSVVTCAAGQEQIKTRWGKSIYFYLGNDFMFEPISTTETGMYGNNGLALHFFPKYK